MSSVENTIKLRLKQLEEIRIQWKEIEEKERNKIKKYLEGIA